MEDTMTQAVGAVVGLLSGLVSAVVAYLKVASDRKKSAAQRDEAEENITAKVARLEQRMDSLEEIREDVKGMKQSFDRLLGFLQAKFGADGFKG